MAKIRHIFALLVFAPIFGCGPALTPRPIQIGGTSAALASGIIAFYHFDETHSGTAPGGKDFADASGNNHHGTAIGSITYGTAGVSNTAITSNGAGAVSIPIDLSAYKTITISINVWSHITSTNPSNILFDYTSNGSSTAGGFGSSIDDNVGPAHVFTFFMSAGGANNYGRYMSNLALPIWHNVIAIYDRSNAAANSISVYVDGALTSTTSYPSWTINSGSAFANSTLYLLCRNGATSCLKADIDELVLWNRALTSDEINTFNNF